MLRDVLIQKGLSNREAEVAELVSKGLSNKEVANRLFVTEKTVKFHLTNIYKKMHVKSRAQLIVWCLPHMGFVEAQTNQQQINTAGAQGNQTNIQGGIDSIPAGNTTVTSNIPVDAPGAGSTGTGMGTGTGTGTGNTGNTGGMGMFGL
jgi:LuxR family transcriptional regulator, positive regulator of biofilm formation